MFSRSVTATVFLFLPFLAGAAAHAAPARTNDSAASAATLPAALRPVLYQALARDAGPAYAVDKHDCATVPDQRLTACFDRAGAHFRRRDRQLLTLALAGFGRGTHLAPVAAIAPSISGNTIAYHGRTLSAWWRVLPAGFEQGFTIARRPAGSAPLLIALTASASSAPIRDADQLVWGTLHYGGLVTTDAAGHVVPSTMTTENGRILLTVNDAHATYPLTVDPLAWVEQEVFGEAKRDSNFGLSVAISGTSALVGSPAANAAWVFTKSGDTWSRTAKLTPTRPDAASDFGLSVALDGTTALVGANLPYPVKNAGFVAVFTNSSGTWSRTQTLLPDPPGANVDFGHSVAVDGATILVGAWRADVGGKNDAGAAFVFTNSGGTWSQTQELSANPAQPYGLFSSSVALDGTTALIGAEGTLVGHQQGAAFVFTQSGGTWSQTATLSADTGTYESLFGHSVALDGGTAVIGAPRVEVGGNTAQGAAFVFTASGGWRQAAELTASDGAANDNFGNSVSLAGTTALVGAYHANVGGNGDQGAVYVFAGSGSTWQQMRILTASDGTANAHFGSSVALNGLTALVGAPSATIGGKLRQGAGYFYSATCPQGYSAHDGTLSAGGTVKTLPYKAPAGMENAILGGPRGIQLYLEYSNGGTPRIEPIPGNEIHKEWPAGIFLWIVKAGDTGGAYLLCVLHP